MNELFAAATAAIDAGDLPAAEMLLRRIVDADPRAHPAWDALAIVALRSGVPDAALARAQRAVELDRRNPFYRNSLGVALGELGRYPEAEAAFRHALKLKPVYLQALFNLGKVLIKRERLSESVQVFERAYAIEADYPDLRYQLAYVYRLSGRPDAAQRVLDEVPGELDSQGIETYAMCVLDLEGPEAEARFLREQAARHPHDRNIRETLGRTLLSIGRWREGWIHYRANREPQPALLPERLDGKRILLLSEQGLGDVVFFLRFVPEIQARGGLPVLSCPPRLAAILRSPGLELVGEAAHREAFDVVLAVGDLPMALQTETTPGPLPLHADPGTTRQWQEALSRLGAPPYLGLTWRAGTDTVRRQEFGLPHRVLSKEVPPASLGAAVRGWRGTLISVQRDPYPGETDALAAAAAAQVHDLSRANTDLADALALAGLLDEYATVSNTNVHLRAALGRTARVLVPRPPEWRWMSEGRESPWFPGFPIYRQPSSRDWSEPLAALRRDLRLS